MSERKWNLDTNVLVRYIAQDDERQSAQATEVIESPGFAGHVTLVALVETVWVLKKLYGADKAVLTEVVQGLLTNDAIQVESAETVEEALGVYRESKADFSDCLIAATGRVCWSAETLTFDRKAVSAGMRLVGE